MREEPKEAEEEPVESEASRRETPEAKTKITREKPAKINTNMKPSIAKMVSISPHRKHEKLQNFVSG